MVVSEKCEDQVVLFLDFLGFREASNRLDNSAAQLQVLELLKGLSILRSNFSHDSEPQPDGSVTHKLQPAISTFSDHIVMSYPVGRMDSDEFEMMVIISQIERAVSVIASGALALGFLIRGGVAFGKLYHSNGVVFGKGMIEAFELESKTAFYPRVVLSHSLINHSAFPDSDLHIRKDFDGVLCIDYFFGMLFRSSQPGDNFQRNVKTWFEHVVPLIKSNITNLTQSGKLQQRAKWVWFLNTFAAALERKQKAVESLDIRLDALSHPV
jgi:hypothetical protein